MHLTYFKQNGNVEWLKMSQAVRCSGVVRCVLCARKLLTKVPDFIAKYKVSS